MVAGRGPPFRLIMDYYWGYNLFEEQLMIYF